MTELGKQIRGVESAVEEMRRKDHKKRMIGIEPTENSLAFDDDISYDTVKTTVIDLR